MLLCTFKASWTFINILKTRSISFNKVIEYDEKFTTLKVYGDPLEHPQQEKYWGNVNCIGERSCYDEGKRAAECLTFDYMREHGMEASHSYTAQDSQFVEPILILKGSSTMPTWQPRISAIQITA